MRPPSLTVSLLAMASALSLASASANAAPLKVGVLPLSGNADSALLRQGSEVLVRSLRGIESIQVVSLIDVENVLGPKVRFQIEQCTTDACIQAATRGLNLDRLVIGRVEVQPAGAQLAMRLVDTTTTARVLVRLSRDLAEPLRPSTRAAIMGGAAELFPELADQSFGTLTLDIEPSGAEIWLDDEPLGQAPVLALKVKAGWHMLRATADGHDAIERRVQVFVGQVTEVELELERRRSSVPWILIGSAAAVGAVGLGFGISAQATASQWEGACDVSCEPGFTRERYESDRSTVDTYRGVANGMFIGAGALSIGALVTYILDPGVDG